MNYPKIRKISHIAYIIVDILLLLTMFVPMVSLDKYTEYDFNYGYYNEDYQSHTTPIATKITPAQLMTNIFANRSDVSKASVEYKNLQNKLLIELENGKITAQEYEKKLANSKITSRYISLSLHFGNEKSLSRLKDRMFLYSIIIFVFYCIVGLFLILNIINFFKRKKLLSIANVFGCWVLVVLFLIFNLFTFSQVITTTNNIEGFNGTIMEMITTCMSPRTFSFIVLFTLVAFAIFTTYLDRIDTKFEKQNEEIPFAISENISNKNKYRKINSKKSKYKNGSKKKRHR